MNKQIAKTLFYPNFRDQQKIGAEIEFFIVYKDSLKRLYLSREQSFFDDLFHFLVEKVGFERSKKSKTIIFSNDDFGVISFEPGSQIEFASHPAAHPEILKKSIQNFFTLFDQFTTQYAYENVRLYRSAYYTGGEEIASIPMLENERYKLVHNHFSQFGSFADDMMKCTCALQLHFDYASLPDLVKKMNRILLAQPILLYLSSNSMSEVENCYSFRRKVLENGDPSRSGTPAGEEIFEAGTWNMSSYIKKILAAPLIFPLNPDWDYFQNLDHHISVIVTDIRVRNTIELRYLDCPKEELLFPLIQLTYSLIYDNRFWSKFEALLPYEFYEIPAICNEINHGTEQATVLWKDVFAAPFIQLLGSYGRKKGIDFSAVINKVNSYECLVNYEVEKEEVALSYSMP